MFQEFIKSMFLILMAEMGDKTQILAMAFATRYKVKKVIAGIFIGSLLNHGIAVALGSYISRVIPLNFIQVIAGALFIGFAIWTLRAEDEEDDGDEVEKYGPVATVAIAFFIGELGDKTQLAAITLASDAYFPALVLAGTVTGMVITGGLGIFIGIRLGKKVPEITIKIASAAIFMLFGSAKLYSSLPQRYTSPLGVAVSAAILAAIFGVSMMPLLKSRKSQELSVFRKKSQELYEFYNKISEGIGQICLGEGNCTKCEGKDCAIGYAKLLVNAIQMDEKNREKYESIPDLADIEYKDIEKSFQKGFDTGKVEEALYIIDDFWERVSSEDIKIKGEDMEKIEQIKKLLDGIVKKYY